jgi:histidinol-phosphate aminotransferase
MASVSQLVEQWIRPEIRDIRAYHVQPADNMIKLDAMENPYSWTPEMQGGWIERVRGMNFNRYPDPGATRLRERLRAHLQLPDGQEILFGNGSDELIQLLMMAISRPGLSVLSVSPTFVMYDMIARFVGLDYHSVALKADFSLDLDAVLAAIEQHKPALVFIAYPNNPTGNAFDRKAIEGIIEHSPGLVIVDEAYNAFAEDTFLPDIEHYANLLVMRTFSKVGLAGFRLGYLVGHQAWIEQIDKIRLPYNINVVSQAGVCFALEHQTVLAAQAEQIKQDREALAQALAELPGVLVYPSQANFLTLRVPENQANRIFEGLKQDGILIKNLSPNGGLLQDCLRVTVGAPNENQAFLNSFKAHLQP